MFLVMAIIGIGWMLVSHFEIPAERRDGWSIAFVAVPIACFVWMASLARTRVAADGDGVSVSNPVRRHRVAWSDIAGFGWGAFRWVNALEPGSPAWSQTRAMRWARRAGLGFFPKTCLVLGDGTVVPMFALQGSYAGVGRGTRRGIRALERGLAARRGEPLPPWPLPRRLTSSGWVPRLLVAAGLAALLAADYRWVDQAGAAGSAGVVLVVLGAWRWARVRVRAESMGCALSAGCRPGAWHGRMSRRSRWPGAGGHWRFAWSW